MRELKRFLCAIILMVCSSTLSNAETITLKWLNNDGNAVSSTTTCESGGDVILPATPTKYGYTFQGWKIKNYIPIEYLESTGTQYIDTGYIFNSYDSKMEVIGSFNTIGESATPSCLWGFLGLNGLPRWLLCSYKYDGPPSYLLNLNITEPIPYIVQDTEKHTFVARAYLINSTKYWSSEIDGSTRQQNVIGYPEAYESNTLHSYLFARNNSGTAGNFASGKIYSAKFYVNNTLVRDMIPVLDMNDVPCMFDKVTRQLFYNQGTGNFIAGPVISE